MHTVARRTYAALLPLIFGLAWIPLEAFAQLPLPCIPGLTCPRPDTTPPTVSITSPASGATVSGTITVTANASDNVAIADVQFFRDGGRASHVHLHRDLGRMDRRAWPGGGDRSRFHRRSLCIRSRHVCEVVRGPRTGFRCEGIEQRQPYADDRGHRTEEQERFGS